MKSTKRFNLTLIELVVVILINIGLVSYFIPIFLDSYNSPNLIGTLRTVLKAEEVFYMKKKTFTPSTSALNVNLNSEYKVDVNSNAVFVIYIPSNERAYRDHGFYKLWRSRHIRSYVGAVFVDATGKTSKILCALEKASNSNPSLPSMQQNQVICGQGTFKIPDNVNNFLQVNYP